MEELKIGLIVFIIIYLFYLFFVILNKKQMKKFSNNMYYKFLTKNFKLDEKKLETKKIAHIIALANATILSITFLVTEITNNLIYKMIIGFATLVLLELIIYYLIGKVLQKKYEIK